MTATVKYKTPLPSIFSTPFGELYDAIWDAEARFDLLFRQDRGVHVWAANRVRIYYELAAKLGIYSPLESQRSSSVSDHQRVELCSLPEFDAYVQTGALGPATANRSRDFGCVYTEHHVKALLAKGRSVLLLHDAPDKITHHPGLRVLTSQQLAAFSKQTREYAPALSDCQISDSDAEFWTSVDAYFRNKLGVSFVDRGRIDKMVLGHARNLATQNQLFDRIRPKCLILMAHYFRASQIEAARNFGTRVIDYQHGINSRYHLGYGFPHIKHEHRTIPYYPDEFWSWGEFWTDPDWFPSACCDTRAMGHSQADHRASVCAVGKDGSAAKKTLLCATSWAMQDMFLEVADNLARSLPEWNIVIKLHPRESTENYEQIARSHRNMRIIPGHVNILEASRTVDIVVSICSSSLFDVLLNDCRVMVIDAPSVEYSEDFVRRYDVPVLKIDCSNLHKCIESCGDQSIPRHELFENQRTEYLDITFDSITSPPVGSQPKASSTDTRRKIKPPGAGQPSIHKRLYEMVYRAVPDAVKRRISTSSLKTPFVISSRLYAKVRARAGGKLRQVVYAYTLKPLITIPNWAKFKLAPRRPYPDKLNKVTLVRAIGIAEVLQDDQELAARIVDAVKLGTPTQSYRTKYLRALWRMEQISGQDGPRQSMQEYIAAVSNEELFLNLPILEHAIRLGVEDALLERFDVTFGKRKWRTASALLASNSHLARRMCDEIELMADSSASEWLDSRVNRADQEGLFANIAQRLRVGEPFAMMRLGDGESYGFAPPYVKMETQKRDQLAREKVWWGKEQLDSMRVLLRKEFQHSLAAVDYLGVPSPFRLLRDIPPFLNDLRRPIDEWHKTPRAHFVLFTEIAKLLKSGALDLKDKHLIDDRCHQPLFTPSSTLTLLSGLPHVVSISCFQKDRLNAVLNADLFDDQILLPPHQKVLDIVPDSAIKMTATPDLLDDLYLQIDTIVRPGSTVIVAGGFVGKLLIARAKKNGGMVLDIGASADYWVGRATRGEFDFVDYATTT